MHAPAPSVEPTQVTEWCAGAVRLREDALASEEPLEIRLDDSPLTVTMRTPGHDVELAAGFLLTEGIIESADQVVGFRAAAPNAMGKSNVVDAQLTNRRFEPESLKRNFFAASSCGICGKASIEAIRRRGLRAPDCGLRVTPEMLCGMPERLRAEQAVFERTGGLHAAALFDEQGNLAALREDIGRHNAVDKVIGWALLNGRLPLSGFVLMVSGRGGFEIVQKALAAGIPIMVCVSAPSSLAVALARELGLTLIGFLRGQRFIVYSGGFRCLPQQVTERA